MFRSGETIWLDMAKRVGLWFSALLTGAASFSLLFALFFFGALRLELLFPVFLLVIRFAFPVWGLCLPLVIALKTAEGWRVWLILAAGVLIGPASLALWSLSLLRRGADPQVVWNGDPLLCGAGGMTAGIVFASVVGGLTASFYVFALRRSHSRPRAVPPRVWRGAA